MSYHKFSNLREIFQGDLNRKLMDGIISCDFMDQPCNCNRASKIDGKCAYNGECRKMCVVYKATCRICNQPYIGQTQQKLKDCMGQHLNDVKKLVTKGTKSDSFASYFTQHCKKEVKPTSDELAMQNDESQNRLARKCDKLHEIIWEIELFIVYGRKDRDSVHNLSGGMENYKPLQ
jgi:hypothetical protein